MNSDIYYKNLNALETANPTLFYKLSNLSENTKYDVTLSQQDPLDINIIEISNKQKMYTNPVEDTLKQISSFDDYLRYPFLAFYGFGNGVFLKAILQNEIHQKIVVVEPEPEILFIALHFMDFSEAIQSERLVLFLEENADYPAIRWFIGTNKFGQFLKTYRMHIMSPYYNKYQSNIVQINKTFIDAILHFIKAHGNDATDSLVGIDHFWQNIPRMLKNPSFYELLGKKNAQTAIIVATGPSLTKQLPLLKEIQEHVTIISVDASMPILEKWGIKPDIVTSLERVKETAKFFKNTSKKFQKDIVFLSSALQHKEIYKNIKDGQLVIPMRPFGYMQILGIDEYGYIGIGMSSANMAFELAFLMNYKSVIFIGQDLAYGTDGKSHAQNHVYGEDEVKIRDEDSFITSYGGKGLARTNDIWRLFLGFFVSAIADAKKYLVAYNCTEGGVRIDGTVEIPFKEAIEKVVDRNFYKKQIVLEKPTQALYAKHIKHVKKNMTTMLKYGKDAKKSIEKLFLDVAKECERLESLNKTGKLEKINFEKVKKLLERIDVLKEISATETFRRMFWDTTQSYILSQELDLAVIAVKPFKTEIEQKAKMIEFLFAHKAWLFMLAGGVDAVLVAIEKNKDLIEQEVEALKLKTKKG
ncbi:MAG: motility associated factor glycosyltransferase family protein [Campylobacterales bacterium]